MTFSHSATGSDDNVVSGSGAVPDGSVVATEFEIVDAGTVVAVAGDGADGAARRGLHRR